jgi:hypothetical protein
MASKQDRPFDDGLISAIILKDCDTSLDTLVKDSIKAPSAPIARIVSQRRLKRRNAIPYQRARYPYALNYRITNLPTQVSNNPFVYHFFNGF